MESTNSQSTLYSIQNLTMCKVSNTSSRRNHCIVHAADTIDTIHSLWSDGDFYHQVSIIKGNTTLKHRVLQDEEEQEDQHQHHQHHHPIPQTITVQCALYDETEEQHHQTFSQTITVEPDVFDDYIIFPKIIGTGNYGSVRECIHRITRQTFACKSIDKSKIARLDHLQNEVQLLSEMNHRCIMRMVGCYEDEEYVHIITEKYDGGELFDKIIDCANDNGCLSEEKAAGIIKSLLEAVAYLHENDIVHRDIKPENILFESEEENAIRLIDFGLSRRHKKGEEPMSNSVGTSYYMSPELLNGNYNKSTDMWSVGTVVYILLCGYPPFNGNADPGIFKKIKEGNLKFPVWHWGDKSDEAKDFIKCLLKRDPRKRYTAKAALDHPWIQSLGKKQAKKVERRRFGLF
mmetsp:Transcript_28352/g.60865  ORF Transcript_28352/g.60865 Transcript_28352/m.60865 type:complete len:403 (-) Transcript_28352:119-1327(-)